MESFKDTQNTPIKFNRVEVNTFSKWCVKKRSCKGSEKEKDRFDTSLAHTSLAPTQVPIVRKMWARKGQKRR